MKARGGGPAARSDAGGARAAVPDRQLPSAGDPDDRAVHRDAGGPSATTPATVTVKGLNFVRRVDRAVQGKPLPTRCEARRRSGPRSTPRRYETGTVHARRREPAPIDPFFTKGMWAAARPTRRTWIVNYKY